MNDIMCVQIHTLIVETPPRNRKKVKKKLGSAKLATFRGSVQVIIHSFPLPNYSYCVSSVIPNPWANKRRC